MIFRFHDFFEFLNLNFLYLANCGIIIKIQKVLKPCTRFLNLSVCWFRRKNKSLVIETEVLWKQDAWGKKNLFMLVRSPQESGSESLRIIRQNLTKLWIFEIVDVLDKKNNNIVFFWNVEFNAIFESFHKVKMSLIFVLSHWFFPIKLLLLFQVTHKPP